MHKVKKLFFSLLFASLIMLALSANAFAEGDASVTKYIRSGDGSVNEWNDGSCSPNINATNIELAGVYIYCPPGYYVYSAELNGIDLMPYANASATTTEVVIPALTFTYYDGYNAPVHLAHGEEQNLNVTFAHIAEESDIIISYNAGVNALPSSLREQNTFKAENGMHIVKGMGQEFAVETPAGWLPGTMKLIYPNGSSVEVYSGQYIRPYQSCTIQVVYVLPITMNIKPYLSANYGEALPQGDDAYVYNLGYGVDGSGITATADVNYRSTAVGRQHVELSNVRVYKGGKELNSNELQLVCYDGAIDIMRAPLTITAGSSEKTYDGMPLADGSFSADNLQNGDTIESAIINASITSVGTVENTIYGAVITNNGQDVSLNYDVRYESGSLTINPAPLNITAKDCKMVYNGHPQSAGDYNIIGKLAEGDTLTVESSGTATYVSDGTVTSVPSSAHITNPYGYDVTACYDITLDTVTSGSLTIVPRPITVIANSLVLSYNGEVQSADGHGAFVSEDTPLADTDALTYAITGGELTYVGETAISVSSAELMCGEIDVTDNYDITYNPGKLSIVPATEKGTVSIVLGGTKVYDGTELTDAYSWEADELACNVADVRLSGASIGPAIGTKELKGDNVTIELYDHDGNMLDMADYNIAIKNGSVSITKQNLKISPTDTQKSYDGKAYVGSIELEGTLSSGQKVTVSAMSYPYSAENRTDGTAVGTYKLKIDPSSIQVKDTSGIIITDNFKIDYGEAVLKVSVAVGTANYSKAYGGTITINCSISPSALSAVCIDGVTLTKGTDYSLATGSATLITFVNSYLKDLSTGNHTLVLSYENAGSVSTTISVSTNGKTTSSALENVRKGS